MTLEALHAAALSAGLAVPGAFQAPDLARVGPRADAPRIVLAVPLKEAADAQANLLRNLEAGGASFELRIGLAADGDLPFSAAQGGVTRTWSWAELEKGVESDFPAGRFRAAFDGRWLVLTPSTGGPEGRVWVNSLLARYFDAAPHVALDPVTWAVLVQGPASAPEAVGLLRRDQEGNFFLAYRTRAEMANIDWFVAINGQFYGMRPEKGLLTVYTKPVPPAAKKR